jgi:hypothetical protein
MDESQLTQIRRFNRLVTRSVGALETNYLRRGRPLAEARLIFEIGAPAWTSGRCGRDWGSIRAISAVSSNRLRRRA